MEPIRLNRFLATCGLGSRRACEKLILEGKVLINGKRVLALATTVKKSDVVVCDGKEVKSTTSATVLLHKPAGFLCTRNDPKDRPTIYDLLPPPLQTLHYVGRLDNESEGLLLLTNDGELTQHLTHPSHTTEKEYWVVLSRPFRPEDSASLKKGMQLEEGYARADSVEILSPRHVAVVLHQGLNRQIRRMFEILGYEVQRLVRVRIGTLEIGSLKPGKWRHLHEPDLEKLRAPAANEGVKPPKPPRRAPGAKKAAGGSIIGGRAAKSAYPRKSAGGASKKFAGGAAGGRAGFKASRKTTSGGRSSVSTSPLTSARNYPAKKAPTKSAAKRPVKFRSEASWAFDRPSPPKLEDGSDNPWAAPIGKARPAKQARGRGPSKGGAGAKPKGRPRRPSR